MFTIISHIFIHVHVHINIYQWRKWYIQWMLGKVLHVLHWDEAEGVGHFIFLSLIQTMLLGLKRAIWTDFGCPVFKFINTNLPFFWYNMEINYANVTAYQIILLLNLVLYFLSRNNHICSKSIIGQRFFQFIS